MNPADLLPPEILAEDPLLDSAAQLEEAALSLDLEDRIARRIKHPEREISVNLPLVRDSGEVMLSAGLRVQHFRARAGCLGPVQLSPDARLSELRPLALHMTLQCALFDLPLGGSAGAIVCDPVQLSENELRRLVRGYLAALDLRADIFAPTQFAAAWTGAEPACVVGKPAALGGLPDLAAAVAAGWFALISEVLATGHKPLAALRIALQGFDPPARVLAEKLCAAGARIIAVADKSGGLLDERGLDLAAVCAHVAKEGMLYGCGAVEPVRNSDVLESPCDLLITAATERQLNAQNAERIRAPLILEALYNAVTPAAQRILAAKSAVVVPGLLGGAPATLAWFAEWQHALHYSVPEQEHVESQIRRKVGAVYQRVHAAAATHQSTLPDAGRMLALETLASVLRLVA